MPGRIYRTRSRARPIRRAVDEREVLLRRLRPHLTAAQLERAAEVRDLDALRDFAAAYDLVV